MKALTAKFRTLTLVGLVTLVTACPLPYSFNGEGSGVSIGSDPSSPNITAPVIVSYSDTAGASGTLPNPGEFYSNQTTTVTLVTATENAVIYYSDDGSDLTNFSSAKSIGGSSGELTITRTATAEILDIMAVAVGPGMLPSPPVEATVGVSPYPVLTITRTAARISEDYGTADFVITSSVPADAPIRIYLQMHSDGTYESEDIVSSIIPAGGPGTTFEVILDIGETTLAIDVEGQPDDEEYDNDVVLLGILPDPNADPAYSAPSIPASIIVEDNRKPNLNIYQEMYTIADTGETEWLAVGSSLTLSEDLIVNIRIDGTYELGDIIGYPAAGTTFTLTIPGGQSSVPFEMVSVPDIGEYDDETVVFTILPDPVNYERGEQYTATVDILDTSPVATLSLTAVPTTISDNQSTNFTLTADVPPEADLTITLQTSGTYEPADVTGIIPAAGNSFEVVLPQGDTTRSFTMTANPDLGEYDDETASVALVSTGPSYLLGSPSSRTITINDTSPVGSLTLTADRSSMTDGQSATFTLTASVAPDADLPVSLSSTGYDVGKVIVPTVVTLTGGTTSRTFLVSAPAEVGYEAQNPQVSLSPGTGYTIGTPNSQSVVVTDDVYGSFSYIGYWGLDGGNVNSPVGTLGAVQFAGSAGVIGDRMHVDGDIARGDDAWVDVSTAEADLDKDSFTVAVMFRLASFVNPGSDVYDRPIFTGGYSSRWLQLVTDGQGDLTLKFNNSGQIFDLSAAFPAIMLNNTYMAAVSVDVPSLTATVYFGAGTPLAQTSVSLPPGFTWAVGAGDELIHAKSGTSPYSSFDGEYDYYFVANGNLTGAEVMTLIATDPDL